MRYYTKLAIVGTNPNEDISFFQDQLAKKIDEFQVNNRYGAEVQFQANGSQCIALILQYKEKKNED